jgi:hypothetical protein
MPDESIKRRIGKAKQAAKQRCIDLGYEIINCDNEVFCFIAGRAGIYERKIRVVVDEIADNDVDIIKKARILSSQTKEVWCKLKGQNNWETVELDHNNIFVKG